MVCVSFCGASRPAPPTSNKEQNGGYRVTERHGQLAALYSHKNRINTGFLPLLLPRFRGVQGFLYYLTLKQLFAVHMERFLPLFLCLFPKFTKRFHSLIKFLLTKTPTVSFVDSRPSQAFFVLCSKTPQSLSLAFLSAANWLRREPLISVIKVAEIIGNERKEKIGFSWFIARIKIASVTVKSCAELSGL